MPSTLGPLLELQEVDTALDQLAHRRTTLPERAELKSLQGTLGAVAKERAPVAEERAALAKEEKRLEDEAAQIESKAAAEDTRLYSGSVTSPRELQAIQEEIAALKRRQGELEYRAIELMVQIEPLDESLSALADREAATHQQIAQIQERITVAEAEIGAEVAQLQQQRDGLLAAVSAISPAVLREYHTLRPRLGGVAVAKLEAGSCRGCHLKLSAVEYDRVLHEPADAVVHCEECGRILVR